MNAAKLKVQPLPPEDSLGDRAYAAIKRAIMGMDLYGSDAQLRLDERQLSADLGVSRTPIREALGRLEQEGWVRVEKRRGVFVRRKTKREIIEMITVWAALEGMAARLITQQGTDAEIAGLRELFTTFNGGQKQPRANIDEYSERNIAFHQKILEMSRNGLINQIADNLFAHMRAIRLRTIGEKDRPERSIVDHLHIIEALEQRDTERAEQLARQHTLDLAAHVEQTYSDPE